ncbi:MAG: aspartate kinase, partial [Phycisphaerales bacterium]
MEGTRVLKFGGTSLATPDLLRAAADRVAAFRRTGVPVAVVVSAMGHATDELVTLAAQVAGPRPTPRELDVLLATGEQASAAL